VVRLLLVWVHVSAATVWVGGLLYGSHLVVPGLQRGERAYAALLRRGRLISVSALGLLVATGLLNWAWLGLRSYWLFGKLLLVLALIPLAVQRDFGLLPAALAQIERGGDPRVALSGVRALDRVVVLLALAVLFVAVGVARGR
jgi:putative copper export protein